jgi:hypothetical protein
MDTIRNISLVGKIRNETAALFEQAERAGNAGNKLHQLDVDIMLAQTRRIYEYLLQLETAHSKSKVEEIKNFNPEPAQIVIHEPVFEEKPTEEKSFDLKTDNLPLQKTAEENPFVTAQQKPEQEADYLWEQPATVDIQPKEQVFAEQPIATPSTQKTKGNQPNEKSAAGSGISTLDLFGESAHEIIADKLSVAKDNSVAAKIERSKINDLRQAIGINEKFLFINDLFEGNFSYYNKAIDELNSFHSLNGARTYFIELSVQYRWQQESAAKEKLMNLIERKFEA